MLDAECRMLDGVTERGPHNVDGDLPKGENGPNQGHGRRPGLACLHDPTLQKWLVFEQPERILCARAPGEILPLLGEVERLVENEGRFAAGFISYEAAPAFDGAFQTASASGFPLAWFGIYERATTQCSLNPHARVERGAGGPSPLPSWPQILENKDYLAALQKIRGYIRAGETYQVNFSFRMRAAFEEDPWRLFLELVKGQGAHYSAFMETEEWSICSASPELFFRLEGSRLTCRPMKGTAARGLWAAEDEARGSELRNSPKDRAENTMIVDMVRNDLGRVARPGTVKVEKLFEIEKFPTLWQMTSTVSCETGVGLPEIFRALFPAASITGAPKVRTMQIIRELEQTPRNLYTGAIGFLAPGRRAQFNVAIRTLTVDQRQRTAEYGIGSGIVWDSRAEHEWEECKLKMRIVKEAVPDFDLLETMLWEPERGYFLLDRHLARLAASADYFCRPAPGEQVRQRLQELAGTFRRERRRVRVTVGSAGDFSIREAALPEVRQPYRLTAAAEPVCSQDRFLYHKTTQRRAYEQALASRPGFDDVLLWNEKGELTESTVGNIVIEKGGELLTPPISSGLLSGVYREFLLESKTIREEVLTLDDLAGGSKLYLINSVRQRWEALFTPVEEGMAQSELRGVGA